MKSKEFAMFMNDGVLFYRLTSILSLYTVYIIFFE